MRKLLCLGLLLSLGACGGDQYSPYGGTDKPTAIKIGKPYDINGKTYAPRYQPAYSEVGMASWYGPGFNGRMTASGEKFNTASYTAAHPTLPMPSIVQVTRIDDGRSVKVRVNDRGPFSKERIIDLSRGAAEQIGLVKDGKTLVRVEYLSDETESYIASLGLEKPAEWYATPGVAPDTSVTSVAVNDLPEPASMDPNAQHLFTPAAQNTSPQQYIAPASSPAIAVANAAPMQTAPSFNMNFVADANAAPVQPKASLSFSDTSYPASASGTYKIQVGAFGVQENAQRLADTLAGIASPQVVPATAADKPIYRVLLGPIASSGAANSVLEQVKAKGYRDARIIVE